VVGSGISGLYCAALLAKAGRRVLVLEQHYVAGGCTHCFEDKGWEFDTGVHYVGRVEKYGYLLDMVSAGPKVQWQQLGTEANGFVYDELKVGDAPAHKLRAGKDAFLADLIEKFPDEEKGLREYLALVVECNSKSELHFFGKLFPLWAARLLEWAVGSRFQELASLTLQQVLDRLFVSSMLKALLSSQFGDYGLPPNEASFFIHAGVVAHYLNGAYYPIGGPQVVTRALIPTICAAGGRVLVNAPVSCILTSASGAACGVEIDGNHTQIFAPIVISAAGAYATELMVESVSIIPPLVKPLLGGISHVYAFIGIDGDSKKLKLPSSNLWSLPGEDINADCKAYYNDPFSKDSKQKQLMFIGFPSSKDPAFASKYPGKSNCVIITEAKAEWFDQFKNTETGKRTAEYEALKLKFKNKLLTGLYEFFPQLDGRVR
jgi:all-trans-retinol 13,14-reductase